MFKLEGKNILVVGGGKVALRKIKAIEPYNPLITVISLEFLAELEHLIKTNKVKAVKKAFEKKDITNKWDFVFACTNDKKTNNLIADLCNRQKIPVNVVDNPKRCDFYTAAVLEYDEFFIAISAKGKNPTLAKKIKEKLKGLIDGIFL